MEWRGNEQNINQYYQELNTYSSVSQSESAGAGQRKQIYEREMRDNDKRELNAIRK